MHRLRASASPSRSARTDDLGDVRGGAGKSDRYAGRSDGFHAVAAWVSKTCLVRFDNNRYSVSAHAVGRPVEIRAYAERIELRQDGRLVGDHARSFGRDQTVLNPGTMCRY